MKFTDLLDKYLSQKERIEKLKEGFDGYGFSDVFYCEIANLEKAKNDLNNAFESE
jgi:hypothetical protein